MKDTTNPTMIQQFINLKSPKGNKLNICFLKDKVKKCYNHERGHIVMMSAFGHVRRLCVGAFLSPR